MSTPAITYVQLVDGDPVWDLASQLTDLDAVAQVILTKLKLFEGEWWASKNSGLPLWQSILGQSGSAKAQQQIAVLISQQITSTPYVVGITSLQTSFSAASRGPYIYSAVVNTQFGQLVVTNAPQPPSGALP